MTIHTWMWMKIDFYFLFHEQEMSERYRIEVTRVNESAEHTKVLLIDKIDKNNYVINCDGKHQKITIPVYYMIIEEISSEFIRQFDEYLFPLHLPVFKLLINVLIRLWSELIVPPLIKCKQDYARQKNRLSCKSWVVCCGSEDVELEQNRDKIEWIKENEELTEKSDNTSYDYNSLFRRLITYY